VISSIPRFDRVQRGREVLPITLAGLVSLFAAMAPVRGEPPALDPKDVAFFETKVRPVLVEKCYSCHSSEGKKVRGGLLLDSRAGWAKGGDSGPAIVPGDPETSLLVQAVKYTEPDLQMPPKGKLPEETIDVLVEWVKRGAPDPRTAAVAARKERTIDLEEGRKWWAFRPLDRPEPPKIRDEAWCRTPIDRFILARLEEKGIRPAPKANRRQWLRRASFDLTGLPPSPEAIDTFLADTSSDAFEKVIDRLLASPAYGERWARHWLDLARFAESHGFEHDYDRPTAFPYRDFVIEALNRDLPYDTFVRWQLAGDEFAPEDPLALKATGFLAAGVHSTQITANQVEKERYDELDDIVNTTGTAMLGLTIGCARCHDHKYDPIPQRDYYRLVSTFTTTVRTEVELNVPQPEYEQAHREWAKAHAPFVEALKAYETAELGKRFEAFETGLNFVDRGQAWVALEPTEMKSAGGAKFTKLDDGSIRVGGKNAASETYTVVTRVDRPGIAAIRLEALADDPLVKQGPGRAANGNFDLSDFRLTAGPVDGSNPAEAVVLKNPRATFEQAGLPLSAAIDGDKKSGWAIDPKFGQDHAAVFEAEKEIDVPAILTFTLDFRGNTGHNLGRFRLSVGRNPTAPIVAASIPQSALAVLDIPHEQRSPAQVEALKRWFRTIDPGWRTLRKAIDDHARTEPRRPVVKALISSEGLPAVRLHTQGADFLDKTHFLKRGDPNQKLEEAPPGYLRVLMSPSEEDGHWRIEPPKGWRTSYRRRALAEWITDEDAGAGHLLARVIVNRLWQHHFGRGIVATPSDFGAQGERPSHPELLDWLASELIASGWRLKPIHRMIMQSAVYREGVEPDPASAAIDPDNTLFGHRTRRRLEAETIRDAMLAVSGTLDPTMYGPGTLDEHQKRRSVYFTVKRSQLIPMMVLFDAPDALQGTAVRPSTTIAPQSLLLMNSPIVREWASGLARRILAKTPDAPDQEVALAYAIALGRPPSATERADALAFLDQQERSHGHEKESRLAALADFCQVLMSLNEFVFVE
jgi:hypothetical protein